jgi:hypothetical protein
MADEGGVSIWSSVVVGSVVLICVCGVVFRLMVLELIVDRAERITRVWSSLVEFGRVHSVFVGRRSMKNLLLKTLENP